MFLIIVLIYRSPEESSTSEFLLTEVSLEQKYLKQPVVYLSGCNTFSEGLPFHDYFKSSAFRLLLVYY